MGNCGHLSFTFYLPSLTINNFYYCLTYLGLNTIPTMSDQQAFEELKDFFENRAVCRQAADSLRSTVEIGVIINDTMNCAFFKDGENPRFEAREAKKPDVVFYIKPDAIKGLIENKTDDIG